MASVPPVLARPRQSRRHPRGPSSRPCVTLEDVSSNSTPRAASRPSAHRPPRGDGGHPPGPRLPLPSPSPTTAAPSLSGPARSQLLAQQEPCGPGASASGRHRPAPRAGLRRRAGTDHRRRQRVPRQLRHACGEACMTATSTGPAERSSRPGPSPPGGAGHQRRRPPNRGRIGGRRGDVDLEALYQAATGANSTPWRYNHSPRLDLGDEQVRPGPPSSASCSTSAPTAGAAGHLAALRFAVATTGRSSTTPTRSSTPPWTAAPLPGQRAVQVDEPAPPHCGRPSTAPRTFCLRRCWRSPGTSRRLLGSPRPPRAAARAAGGDQAPTDGAGLDTASHAHTTDPPQHGHARPPAPLPLLTYKEVAACANVAAPPPRPPRRCCCARQSPVSARRADRRPAPSHSPHDLAHSRPTSARPFGLAGSANRQAPWTGTRCWLTVGSARPRRPGGLDQPFGSPPPPTSHRAPSSLAAERLGGPAPAPPAAPPGGPGRRHAAPDQRPPTSRPGARPARRRPEESPPGQGAARGAPEAPERVCVDGRGRLAVPDCVDAHAHLDRPSPALPGGPGAGNSLAALINNSTIAGRAAPPRRPPSASRTTSLLAAYVAAGTSRIRSHVDVDRHRRPRQPARVIEAPTPSPTGSTWGSSHLPPERPSRPPRDRRAVRGGRPRGADLVDSLKPPASSSGGSGALNSSVFTIADRNGCGIDIHLHDGGELGAVRHRPDRRAEPRPRSGRQGDHRPGLRPGRGCGATASAG